MLDIRVTIEGDKVVIAGLQAMGPKIDKAIRRGLTRSAKGIYDDAFRWLSGAGSVYETRTSKKTGKEYRKKVASILPGQYPVPVRTGHLRRMLRWLRPGASKSAEGVTFTAGPFESVVFNAAVYSEVIHDGTGTSARHGPRPFLTDALKRFNQGEGIKRILESEIGRDLSI